MRQVELWVYLANEIRLQDAELVGNQVAKTVGAMFRAR
jgi:hypothetical protein